MTEYSYFWNNGTTGDETLMPLSDDNFARILRLALTIEYSSLPYEADFVIDSEETNFDGKFIATPTGTNLSIATGIAIVDGRIYTSDAAIVFDLSAVGTHKIVLRKSETAQTVRMVDIGAAALTNDATTWEVLLYNYTSNGATLTLVADNRRFTGLTRYFAARHGGEFYDWTSPETVSYGGATVYRTGNVTIQFGAQPIEATTTTITLPEAYRVSVPSRGGILTRDFIPLVFIMPVRYSAGTPSFTKCYVSEVSYDRFVVTVDNITNLDGFNWIAFGPSSSAGVSALSGS